ncbi:MAG: DUF1579 domain-containing protein [Gemmatimonadota bacterium]|nr:DUF1579 domain-containing protein [Gemmatimonadota bacterium]
MSYRFFIIGFAAVSVLPGSRSLAQGPPNPGVLIAAQRDAMRPLAMMDGVWRGNAWANTPSGEKHTLTQTERIGPFLDGSIKVVEGRGYDADGKVSFNAFAVISYDPATKTYTLHSYAQGRSGDFPLTPNADGYVWEIPAGPMKIRYTAVIKPDFWREIGEYIAPGKEPVQFFEMNLKRLGDTAWPSAGAIPMTGATTPSPR